jgi:hypothetical protein
MLVIHYGEMLREEMEIFIWDAIPIWKKSENILPENWNNVLLNDTIKQRLTCELVSLQD